jgi:hypothetical protein
LEAVPRVQTGNVIFTDKVKETGSRLAFVEGLHSVYGEGRRGTVELHRVEAKPWFVFDRGPHHLGPPMWVGMRLPKLMWRGGGRDEENVIEL